MSAMSNSKQMKFFKLISIQSKKEEYGYIDIL